VKNTHTVEQLALGNKAITITTITPTTTATITISSTTTTIITVSFFTNGIH